MATFPKSLDLDMPHFNPRDDDRFEARPTDFTDLPIELLLDHLLPLLPLKDLLSLTRTCKSVAAVCDDDTLWKLKLKRDFNFTANADTARESGFKVIYKGISKPSLYTWGAAGQSRLGLSTIPKGLSSRTGIPFPARVKIDTRIVSLAAGGWSFHALDDQGSLHVWGTLAGEGFALNNDGFSEPEKPAKTPHRLQVTYPDSTSPSPEVKFTSITCGRSHSAALDASGKVWIFTRWGRPCLLTTHVLQDQAVRQVECGWSNVAILTKSGDAYVVWPFAETDEFWRENDSRNEELNERPVTDQSRARADAKKVIPCATLQIPADPLPLPPIPSDLPILDTSVDERDRVPMKLIRVAAGDGFLIGLTNHGHVLSIDLNDRGGHGGPALGGMMWFSNQIRERSVGWVYQPDFSEVEKIRKNSAWGNVAPPEGPMRITHISAHFRTFFAYSITPSVVLMGRSEELMAPPRLSFGCIILPSLHSRPKDDPVISVVVGDYHYLALTARGSLLSWGKYSSGALGLGDPRFLEVGAPGGFRRREEKEMALAGRGVEPEEEVMVPQEVRWDWEAEGKTGKDKKMFCYGVTASGWHSGALIIDLDDAHGEDTGAQTAEVDAASDAEDPVALYHQWMDTSQAPYPQPWIETAPSGSSADGPGQGHDEMPSIYQSPPFNPGNRSGPPYPLPTGPQRTTPAHPPILPLPRPGRREGMLGGVFGRLARGGAPPAPDGSAGGESGAST